MTASPMNFSTVPPSASISSRIAIAYAPRTSCRSSGSSSSPSGVEPVMSAKRTVTSLRSAAPTPSSAASGRPQCEQKRASSAFSPAQAGHAVMNGRVYASVGSAASGTSPDDRARVGELEVRPRLLEVADDGVVHTGVAQNRVERAQRLDCELHLAEIATVGRRHGGTRSRRPPTERSTGCPRRLRGRARRGAPPPTGVAARQPPIASVAFTCSA